MTVTGVTPWPRPPMPPCPPARPALWRTRAPRALPVLSLAHPLTCPAPSSSLSPSRGAPPWPCPARALRVTVAARSPPGANRSAPSLRLTLLYSLVPEIVPESPQRRQSRLLRLRPTRLRRAPRRTPPPRGKPTSPLAPPRHAAPPCGKNRRGTTLRRRLRPQPPRRRPPKMRVRPRRTPTFSSSPSAPTVQGELRFVCASSRFFPLLPRLSHAGGHHRTTLASPPCARPCARPGPATRPAPSGMGPA